MLTVAIYGNSVVPAGIAARIERHTGLRPVTIDAAQAGAVEQPKALRAIPKIH